MKSVNLVIKNNHWDEITERAYFGKEPVNHLKPNELDTYDILVSLGVYPSKKKARRYWKNSFRDIPKGFTDWKIDDMGLRITIWNPIPYSDKEDY